MKDELKAKVASANLTLKERVDLEGKLKDLSEITGSRYNPRTSRIGTTPQDNLPRDRQGNITLPVNHPIILPETLNRAERLAKWFGVMKEEAAGLADLIRNALTGAFSAFGNAVQSAFAAMVDGSRKAGQAFTGGLLSGLAGVASSFGQFFLQLAAGAIGAGLLFGGAINWAAVGKLTAAGVGLMALAGTIQGAANRAEGMSAGPASASYRSDAIAGAQQARPIQIWVNPFDPKNPVVAKDVGRAMELSVQLSGKPGWAAT